MTYVIDCVSSDGSRGRHEHKLPSLSKEKYEDQKKMTEEKGRSKWGQCQSPKERNLPGGCVTVTLYGKKSEN